MVAVPAAGQSWPVAGDERADAYAGAVDGAGVVAQPLNRPPKQTACSGLPGGSGCGDPVATIAPEAKAADDKVDISVTAAREQPKPQDAGAPAFI